MSSPTHSPAHSPTHATTEQEMELTDSLSRTYTGQEMEDAPGLTGLADEFDFGAIGDELGPEARLLTYYGHLLLWLLLWLQVTMAQLGRRTLRARRCSLYCMWSQRSLTDMVTASTVVAACLTPHLWLQPPSPVVAAPLSLCSPTVADALEVRAADVRRNQRRGHGPGGDPAPPGHP